MSWRRRARVERAPCPLCGRVARIVWRSKDGKTVAIQCSHRHHYGIKKGTWGEKDRPRMVKDLVFIVEKEK